MKVHIKPLQLLRRGGPALLAGLVLAPAAIVWDSSPAASASNVTTSTSLFPVALLDATSPTLRAKVTAEDPSVAATPTGTVSFAINGSEPVQCDGLATNTVSMSGGVATCKVTSALPASGSPVTAQATYGGDDTFAPSTGTYTCTASHAGCVASIPVPGSIASNCSTDVSVALNSFFASVPAGSVIAFPSDGCYLVSNTYDPYATPYPDLLLQNLSHLTIDGNGTTLHQTHYVDDTCSNDVHQPIIELDSNSNLTFNNFTFEGPHECGGANSEGDVGIDFGQQPVGNTNITFNGVTVEDTGGDGIDVYPQLGTCCGINTDVTFENGEMNNIGYHAFVPEGVTGLTIENNTFTNVGNFMDLEVDNNYGPPFNTCDDTYAEGLTGNAQCNITVEDNHFVSSTLSLDSSSNGACIPMGNMKVIGNQMDVNSSFSLVLLGSTATPGSPCPQDNNLTIQNNIQAVCSPAPGTYDGCGTNTQGEAIVQVADWKNVVISGNQVLGGTGSPLYGSNNLYTECVAVVQSANVSIEHNGCNDTNTVWDDVSFQFPPQYVMFANTNITACGNVYWLTYPIDDSTGVAPPADPMYDAACGFG